MTTTAVAAASVASSIIITAFIMAHDGTVNNKAAS